MAQEKLKTMRIMVCYGVFWSGQLSCSQIWNIEEKERETKKVGRQASEAQREKELETKNKGDILCWRNNMKFCGRGEKMRDASSHQGEKERQ